MRLALPCFALLPRCLLPLCAAELCLPSVLAAAAQTAHVSPHLANAVLCLDSRHACSDSPLLIVAMCCSTPATPAVREQYEEVLAHVKAHPDACPADIPIH